LGLVLLAESITVSLRPNCVLERVENSTRAWVVIRIFRVSPQHQQKLMLELGSRWMEDTQASRGQSINRADSSAAS
jgi:hypothetical protein